MLMIQESMDVVGAAFDREQYGMLLLCSEREDMTEWNAWRTGNPECPVRLQTACLRGAWLRGADLHDADLRGANLRGVDLSGDRLPDFSRQWADLRGADCREADLCGTDLRGADLRGVDFGCAYLYYTNFSWTDLRGANFRGADLWAFVYRANVKGVDLFLANRRKIYFTWVGCSLARNPGQPSGRVLPLGHGEVSRVECQEVAGEGMWPMLELAAG